MKMPSVVLFVALASTFFLKSGHAEVSVADVALLTVVQGEVSFQGKDGKARPVVAYMRIRHGDTIRLQKRSIMRLTYTTVPRQEIWTGPGSFVVTLAGELMATSHMGGSVVRSVKAPIPASKEDIAAAMSVYESMRANTSITDVTPELYLYSIFLDNEMYDDLKIVAKDMLIRQPDNTEIRQLAKATLTVP